MYEDLTKREIQVLECIISSISTNGYPPTVREIGRRIGLKSPSSVHGYLDRLEEKDYIMRTASKTRAIVVKDKNSPMYQSNKQTVDVPIVGVVTAGEPILAVENIEGYFPIDSSLAKDKDLFVLRVRGESMINAGIMDGDYVLIEKVSFASNGDIVLALIDESSTIKRFYREDGYIKLQPENDSMEPIYLKNAKILGHVIALYRKIV